MIILSPLNLSSFAFQGFHLLFQLFLEKVIGSLPCISPVYRSYNILAALSPTVSVKQCSKSELLSFCLKRPFYEEIYIRSDPPGASKCSNAPPPPPTAASRVQTRRARC